MKDKAIIFEEGSNSTHYVCDICGGKGYVTGHGRCPCKEQQPSPAQKMSAEKRAADLVNYFRGMTLRPAECDTLEQAAINHIEQHATAEVATVARERDLIAAERDAFIAEADRARKERDALGAEVERLKTEIAELWPKETQGYYSKLESEYGRVLFYLGAVRGMSPTPRGNGARTPDEGRPAFRPPARAGCKDEPLGLRSNQEDNGRGNRGRVGFHP